MQAVVLAAGAGRRMRPLSADVPKPMLPVRDRPIVAHVADAVVEAGVDELVLVLGYEGETVRSYFGREYRGTPVRYAVQEERRGTADAVAAASAEIEGRFAVLNGDNLYDRESIAALLDEERAVAGTRVDAPSEYGVFTTDEGDVTDVVEKPETPPTDVANAGAYVFPESALAHLDVPESERGERELTDVLARSTDRNPYSLVMVDRWMDVGRPWELLEANERLLAQQERDVHGEVHPDADLRGDVVVEPGATVDRGVVVEGPALIRTGAEVGPNAYLRDGTVIGPDVNVGHAVEVKNSLLMRDTSVSHLSYVGDSVLGRDVNFGAGTQVANLRHDSEPVKHTVKGERLSTGRRKFGVVAGDGVRTGINTSLNPGVSLAPGVTTAPGETVTRDR